MLLELFLLCEKESSRCCQRTKERNRTSKTIVSKIDSIVKSSQHMIFKNDNTKDMIWADVLKSLKETQDIPWESFKGAKDLESDEDHLKVCRIVLARIHPSDGKNCLLQEILVKESPHLLLFLINYWIQDKMNLSRGTSCKV